MAAPTTLKLVQNRLPASTALSDLETDELQEFIDEAKVSRDYVDTNGDPEDDANLSWLESGYVADLAAINFLNSRLNRYMEDAKVKYGGDGVTYEKYDKEKFIKQQITALERAAKEKAGKLGFGGNVMAIGLIKVTPPVETDDDD